MLGWVLLAGAAALLVVGAETFVANAAGAARRLGVSVVATGVLLAGAEPEELVTAVTAAAQGRPGLAAGDAVGANVTMLTACLGLAALVRPLELGRRVRQYALMACVAGVLAVLALYSGSVSRPEGLLLVLGYVGLVALVWWREREPPALGELAEIEDESEDESESGGPDAPRTPAASLLLALVGMALMVAGGDLAVRGAVRVVESMGRSDSAVGLTVLALATTAELFALVLVAARHAVPELAVAGVVGSAAYNATATLGAAAVVAPLDLADDGVLGPAVAAAALPAAVLLLARGARLGRPGGAALLLGYVAFLVVVLG